jgi:hypothetical protein
LFLSVVVASRALCDSLLASPVFYTHSHPSLPLPTHTLTKKQTAKNRGAKLDKDTFLEALTALQAKQLGATLANLSPVKNLYIYSVPVTAKK